MTPVPGDAANRKQACDGRSPLIERFATDLYHPKSSEFIGAFSEAELKDLAHLYGLVHHAGPKMDQKGVHSVSDLQKLPEWRQVMSLAKTLHDRFQRA